MSSESSANLAPPPPGPPVRSASLNSLPSPSNTSQFKSLRTDSSHSSLDFLVGASPSPLEEQRIQTLIEDNLISSLHSKFTVNQIFTLSDLLPFFQSGMEAIVADDFSRCFESAPNEPWNFTIYLWIFWICGVFIRNVILFPIRALSLFLGFIVFFAKLLFIKQFIKDPQRRRAWELANVRFLCGAFVFSWHGVIRYHGSIPARKANRIFVANHSSMIDMVILSQKDSFSLVGQKHPGWIGFIQDYVLGCLGNCWFNRGEASDRTAVAKKMKAHISSPDSTRLLVFPEGTCVNNEFVVQFKQGVFDMNAEICPIAIKYNKIFVDAFWNSRRQSFANHLMTLMRSWAVVCDVYYLEPQCRRPEESAIEFSNRVKQLIARRAGLKNVSWDGYLKHFRPSARYVQERQSLFANQLLKKLNAKEIAEINQKQQQEEKANNQKAATVLSGAAAGGGLKKNNAAVLPDSDQVSRKMAAMISASSTVNLAALVDEPEEKEQKKEK